ncbi:MAG: hypothetical protein ABI605_10915 [Rhizobacter sp.]
MATPRILGYSNFAGSAGTDLVGPPTDSGHLFSYLSPGPARFDGSGRVYDAFSNGPRIVSNVRVGRNYVVSAISKAGSATDYAPGLSVRNKPGSDTGIHLYWHGGLSSWILVRYLNTTATALTTYAGFTPTTEVLVELETVGQYIVAYFNGVAQTPWLEDVLLDPGFPGASIIGSNGSADYLRAWSVSGATPALPRSRIISLYVPTGAGAISGVLNGALAAATLGATGTLKLQGVVNSTAAGVTASGAAGLVIQALVGATLGDATCAATGTVPLHASAATTLDAATLSCTGSLNLQGALGATLDTAISQGAAALLIQGTSAAALADVVASASGTLLVVGTLVATLQDAVLSADAALVATGTAIVAKTLEDATVSSTGTLKLQAAAAATLADALAAGAGTLLTTASVSAALGNVTLDASGTVNAGRSGVISATLADAILIATATLAGEGEASPITVPPLGGGGRGRRSKRQSPALAPPTNRAQVGATLADVTCVATGEQRPRKAASALEPNNASALLDNLRAEDELWLSLA